MLGILPKALKQRQSHAFKKELEEIIKAWPDKDSKSSNPEVYENWLEMKKRIPYDMFIDVWDKYTEDDGTLIWKIRC